MEGSSGLICGEHLGSSGRISDHLGSAGGHLASSRIFWYHLDHLVPSGISCDHLEGLWKGLGEVFGESLKDSGNSLGRASQALVALGCPRAPEKSVESF